MEGNGARVCSESFTCSLKLYHKKIVKTGTWRPHLFFCAINKKWNIYKSMNEMKYLQKPRLKHTYPLRHTKYMKTCISANTTNKITNRSFLYTYTSTQIKKRKDMHIHDILQMLPWNGVLYAGYSFKVRNVFLRTADLPINSSAMRSRFIFRLSSLCPWRRAT